MRYLLEINQGEWLAVKRHRDGLDQVEMADRLGLTRHQYQAKEGNQNGKLKRRLSDFEACVIMRNRSKMSQGALAKELGLSRLWVNRMEKGHEDCQHLIDFWKLQK